MLGLEGSELLVGRLASASALANVLQRGPGLTADDELVSAALLGDDEITLQTTADFDVKLLLHRRIMAKPAVKVGLVAEFVT